MVLMATHLNRDFVLDVARWVRTVTAVACVGLFCRAVAQTDSSCHGPQPLESAVQQQPTARNWAALAGWFGERNRFSCAIPAFQQALRIEPSSARLHYYLGLSMTSAGRKSEALEELRRSIQLDGTALEPRLLEGVVLNESGLRAKAEEAWEAALRIDPASTVALDWLAKARIADGQFEEAIDLLEAAPRDTGLTLDLALAYSRSGFFDKAADTLAEALEANKGDLSLSQALATVYVQSHRYQDAQTVLKHALDLHPDDTTTDLPYIEVLILQDEDDIARPIAQRFLETNPHSFDALYVNGILESDAQQYDQAAAHLRQAVELNPSHYDARYNLGVVLAHLHRNEDARVAFEKAVALDPSQAQAHFHLAQVLRALGQTEQAQQELKLFEERQQATLKLAQATTSAGQAAQALKDGNPTQAATLYRQAFEAEPTNEVYAYDLALALDKAGDAAGERVALEQAIALKPGFPSAENRLGLLLARSGDLALAEQHFRKALEAAPRYANAANNLGTLLGQQGRDAEAEALFRSAVSANPRFTEAWVNLAATLASESHFTEARETVKSALLSNPQDPEALRLQNMLASADSASSRSPHTPQGKSSIRVPR